MPFTTAALALFAALPAAGIPWLDPHEIIVAAGPWALLVVCLIVFSETGLLVGFFLPGDTLLVITGLLVYTGTMTESGTGIQIAIWWVALAIAVAAFLGGEVGYLIGHKVGPKVFERKESGVFSKDNVVRTNKFFERWGPLAVVLARFVPVVRTFAPVAAGVAHMSYRRYSLYNGIGALIWGVGVTLGGFVLGFIPPLANFVTEYIDFILLGAVVIAVLPALITYLRAVFQARRARAAGSEPLTDAEVVLDPKFVDD